MKKNRKVSRFKSSTFSHAFAHFGLGAFYFLILAALDGTSNWISTITRSFKISTFLDQPFFMARKALRAYSAQWPTHELLLLADYLPIIIILAVLSSQILIWTYEIFFVEPDRALHDDQASLNFLLSHPVSAHNHLPDLFYTCRDIESEDVEMELISCGVNCTLPAQPAAISEFKAPASKKVAAKAPVKKATPAPVKKAGS